MLAGAAVIDNFTKPLGREAPGQLGSRPEGSQLGAQGGWVGSPKKECRVHHLGR